MVRTRTAGMIVDKLPLGGAAFKGYGEIIAVLLEHGADIDADNDDGMTVPSSQVAKARQGQRERQIQEDKR